MKDGAFIIDNFPKALNDYIAEWRQLESAYYRIPSWRQFKRLKNIKQREKLTKAYEAKMKDWGLIP